MTGRDDDDRDDRDDDRAVLWLDRAAITLSGLCLIHCLGTALFVAVLTTTGGVFFGHGVHEVGLAVAVAIGVVALGGGIGRHGAVGPMLVGGVGLALMAVALALPHGLPEVAFTMSGVSILAVGHLLNRRASGGTIARAGPSPGALS